MKQRGRKSAAKLSVVEPLVVSARAKAPKDLTRAERKLWNDITSSRSADFFDVATLPLLGEYCRLFVQVNQLAAQIDEVDISWLSDDEYLKRYKTMTGIRDQAQGRMIALARTMRLTQQARYVPDKAANHPKQSTPKPWAN